MCGTVNGQLSIKTKDAETLSDDDVMKLIRDEKDGQVVIFGGLRRQEKTKEVDQIPFLGDLPIIGELFKSTKIVAKNSELIIFISPHIYKGEPIGADAMSKYREIRDFSMLSSTRIPILRTDCKMTAGENQKAAKRKESRVRAVREPSLI